MQECRTGQQSWNGSSTEVDSEDGAKGIPALLLMGMGFFLGVKKKKNHIRFQTMLSLEKRS